jgi:D-beta-D-heptose 7-phosphate kinase/D-beta-D-heptose 1-phosphate adenosyltransferase
MDKDGICLCQPDGASRHFETEARVVADVTGAGDMVLSMLGLVLGGGGGVEAACELANVAAGIEIRLVGCTPVPRRDVLRELSHRGFSGSPKLKGLEEILPKLRELQAQGRKVVFSNGCFDILHLGHYHLLDHARRFGDCLVVAINSDASVRRLKGPGRPVMGELDRMLMLSALECVDHVILFNDDTPLRLLEAIRPDVLVKGSEYRDGTVVGRELVESYGGRVELVEQLPGISTTALFERLRGESDGSASGGLRLNKPRGGR